MWRRGGAKGTLLSSGEQCGGSFKTESNAYNTQDMEASAATIDVNRKRCGTCIQRNATQPKESNSDTTGSHTDGPRHDHLQ